MKFATLFLIFFLFNAHADQNISDAQLKNMIARMLIVGFEQERLNEASPIVKTMQKYELGGVILFDRFYRDKNRTKNIRSPKQLRSLTQSLQHFSRKPLFIAIDQEGGKVTRLKPKYGFRAIPSAAKIATLPCNKASQIYTKEAKMLREMGINMNFAPVLDLARNPKNKVIVGLKRSYGKNPQQVAKYAAILIDAQNAQSIISVAKHFPGHGSSLGDSHKGFVDITHTWNKVELKPYEILLREHKLAAIMTAHVFNKKLDATYPATLSRKVNTELLRNRLGFRGVIISDDMQMKAISAHYSLKEATTLAINAGVDILLFGNQLSHNSVDEIVQSIFTQVKNGYIPLWRIKESNRRIANLHTQNAIIQKPIIFDKERIEMTKAYIKKHYGKNVTNITITPKIIVEHWTAVNNFKDSYPRLYPQKLFSDRADIATASALNVSAHYLVDRDGTIYQLMPDNWMARHVIGLNYSSIGIENVGGKDNRVQDLTSAQLQANIRLIRYLKAKYPSICYLIAHYEYRQMEKNPLWLEKDKGYRTKKADPGAKFMHSLRDNLTDLKLRGADE